MDKRIRLIKHFLEGNLTEKEKEEFRKLSLKDEGFRRMIVRATEFDEEFDGMFTDEEAGPAPAPARKNPNRIYIITISAAAALVVFALVIFGLLREPRNVKLYAVNYNPITIDIFRSPGQADTLTSIQKLYLAENYKAIRDIIRENPSIAKFKDLDYILIGVSFMENEEFEMAEKQLQLVPQSSEQYPNAAWYIALIYLKRGDIERCREYLGYVEGSVYFGRKAEKLKKDLPHP